MRWSWIKRAPEPEPDEGNLEEAREARTTAEHDLRRIRDDRSEVERIADKLREIRTENHLAEIFEASLRRRKRGPNHG